MKIYKLIKELIVSIVLSVSIYNIAYAQDINLGSINISSSGNYEVSGKITDTDNNIVISGGNVNIVLNNLDMTCNWYIEPIYITGGAIVNMILTGDNSIVGDYGIVVDYGSKLIISGEGNLYVKADSSAGIGGEMWSTYGVGDITINGGKITAISNSGAGIGSGYGNCETAGTGSIVINGGDVTGISNNDSAGIGSGAFNDIGGITISGKAKVRGESLRGGAGIGYGANVRRSNVAYSEVVEDATTDTLKENRIYKQRNDLNNLGSINISEDAKVESYSYTGSGIGLGARNEGEAAYQVGINIANNANVKATSYKGEAIGKGAYLDWSSSESLMESAPQYVKSNLNGENVFAASLRTRHMSYGDVASITIDGDIKLKATSKLNQAIDTSELTSSTDIINLTIENNYEEELDSGLKLVDTDSDNAISVPSMCKGYATIASKGEYNGITDKKETRIAIDNSGDTLEVDGITNKEITIEENTDLYNTIYASQYGNNSNSGLSFYEPMRDLSAAYKKVNNYGIIVICGGAIELRNLPNLNKNVTITSDDGICDYSNYGCYITLEGNMESLKDKLLITNSTIKTQSGLVDTYIELVDCKITNDIIDTIKLRGYKKSSAIGRKDIKKPYIKYRSNV